jgi:hypothetical protein
VTKKERIRVNHEEHEEREEQIKTDRNRMCFVSLYPCPFMLFMLFMVKDPILSVFFL